MKRIQSTSSQRFVICVDNSGYPASLELHKVYQVLPDERAAEDDYLRVVDESGEDYLYSADRFVAVELPRQVEQSIVRKVKELTMLPNPYQASVVKRADGCIARGGGPTRSGPLTRPSASPRTQKTRARRG